MAWLRRRTAAGPRTDRGASDLAHLENFVQTRTGVEAYLEPKTTVTEHTVILIANDGEWTRRRVPSHEHVRAWGRKIGIPVYDVALTGYPKRMREYNERRRQANQT